MVHEHSDAENCGEKSDLRAGVTLRDLDRRLLFQRIPLFVTRWLALPLMLVTLVGLVLALILGFGSGSPAELIGGIVLVAGAASVLASWAGRQADDLVDLQEERRCLLHDHPLLEAGDARAVGNRGLDASSGADAQSPLDRP